jgi:hypothetical protein
VQEPTTTMALPNPASSLFTQVDISPIDAGQPRADGLGYGDEHSILLRQILNGVERQSQLLTDLVTLVSNNHKQRVNEIGQWKEKHPELSKSCRKAADALTDVHAEFLNKLTEEVHDNYDCLMDGEFMLSEFVDRFGPRLAHLSGVLQVLTQLGTPLTEDATQQS